MAAGRAIVASAIKPIQDVVTHGKEALLVPPNDVSAWASALETLRKNPHFALTLATCAKEKAKTFDWKIRAQKITSILIKT